jgi:hypothetical protein
MHRDMFPDVVPIYNASATRISSGLRARAKALFESTGDKCYQGREMGWTQNPPDICESQGRPCDYLREMVPEELQRRNYAQNTLPARFVCCCPGRYATPLDNQNYEASEEKRQRCRLGGSRQDDPITRHHISAACEARRT